MAPQGRQTHPLRMITQRLAATPADDLPYITSHLTKALLDCKDILASRVGSGKGDSEYGVLLHKYKTQLNTLLQQNSLGARWSAVIMIKATVEAGGLEIVDGAASWVRGLLGYLGVRSATLVTTPPSIDKQRRNLIQQL